VERHSLSAIVAGFCDREGERDSTTSSSKGSYVSKVRLALLGCGGMGAAHVQRLRDSQSAEIVALCDVSRDCMEGIVKHHVNPDAPAPELFSEPAEMYAKAKPDGVIIVTPHTLHFEQGVQALNAGIHVMMEKPMVTNSEQGRALAALAKESGKVFVVGYNTPCTPAFHYLRELIREGRLGKLETVTGWQTQDWRRLTIGTWRQNPVLSGGGQMYDSGAHFFNSLVWSVEQPVAEVCAFVDNVGTPVDINGVVTIKFANGVLAAITISGNSAPDGAGMYFVFEHGRVEIDGWAGAWIKVFERDKGEITPELQGTYQFPLDNFVDAILGRAETRTKPENGLIQSELMDAIYESAQTRSVVKVNHR
jgi:predicted dehydrogenase